MRFADAVSSFFGIGRIKYAPGTAASLATALFILLISHLFFVSYLFFLFFLFFFLIGLFFSERSERDSGEKDPGWIVIDEAAGMFASVSFIDMAALNPLQKIVIVLIAFAVFRIFDILKPFPIRQIQKIKGGWGIMLDDLVAGVFSNFISRMFFYFIFKFYI